MYAEVVEITVSMTVLRNMRKEKRLSNLGFCASKCKKYLEKKEKKKIRPMPQKGKFTNVLREIPYSQNFIVLYVIIFYVFSFVILKKNPTI